MDNFFICFYYIIYYDNYYEERKEYSSKIKIKTKDPISEKKEKMLHSTASGLKIDLKKKFNRTFVKRGSEYILFEILD